MTATEETDVPLDAEPDTDSGHRTPHVLMTIAGVIGLAAAVQLTIDKFTLCLLYTSPSPRDRS